MECEIYIFFLQHDQRLVAVERSFDSIYLMKSGVTVKRIKPQEKQSEEECLILRFEVNTNIHVIKVYIIFF